MTLPRHVDVLIAGGGPAGLATAQTAAAGNARVLVVHRDDQIGLPVRTSGGSWATRLAELHIPSHLYHPLEALTFASATELRTTQFRRDIPVVLDVTATYRYLADLAQAAGAQVLAGALLTQVHAIGPERMHGPFRATIMTTMPSGTHEHQVIAERIVDATGVARTILPMLGLAARFTRLGVGAEYEFVDRSRSRTTAALFVGTRFAPAGYGWIFPAPHGRIRIGVGVIRPDVTVQPKPLLDDFMRGGELDRFGVCVGDLLQKHFGVIPAAAAPERAVFGDVIAVGDSVCQALPLVGEGIRYCIESGRIAGTQIARAYREPGRSAHHLEVYQRWWDEHYRGTFEHAQRANERMCTFTDDQWDAATRFLGALPGDTLASALRMELSPWGWIGAALKNPRATAGFLTRCKRVE